ncbi:MAG: hypothetical protein R2882_04285 [Gemmatimonadales bacterium]
MNTLQIIVWALTTGGITGAVWIGIVALGRQRRLAASNRELLEDRQRTLDELEAITRRVVELEDRLDFTERHLAAERDRPQLPGPSPD